MDRRRACALFEHHHLELYRFLLRRSGGRIEIAEDLTQEVFARALRDGVNVPRPAGERAWLFRIARNLLVDRWRRAERCPEVKDDILRRTAVAAGQELRASLHRALASLPEPEREAFLLGQVAGLRYAEIAEVTASSEAAVRSRIYRARQALRRELGGGDR